jgi:hypothetical protein
MCTTGVLRLGDDDFVLFKNKDFGRLHFDDRIVVERDVFGVAGITTWAGTDPDLDQFSGFSIGANSSGMLVCDSNVQTLPGHRNYDDLVEIALREGTDVASGAEAVRRAVARAPYLWGNLVLIDEESTGSVEVRGDHVHVALGSGRLARSNHHVVLGAHENDDDRTTTELRLASAESYVSAVTSLDDVFALQRSHDDGDTGICNHGLHHTVYTYVLRRRAGRTTLYVGQGRPCEDPPRFELEIPFGDDFTDEAASAFRAAYPSARAMVRA